MKERSHTISERSLGDLLNETFYIYSKEFRQLIRLAAIVMVPMSFISLVAGGNLALFIIAGIASTFALAIVYGATVNAVGQYYIKGEISLPASYSRVSWRILSLLAVASVLVITTILMIGLAILVVPAIVLAVLLVFWTVAIPAVVVEGYQPRPALRRSFALVKDNWWRVLGITLVVLLVLIGLGIVLLIPFTLLSMLLDADGNRLFEGVVQFLKSVVVGVIVPPVGAIAATLLYYDLRVRKENYNVNILSEEMGIAMV